MYSLIGIRVKIDRAKKHLADLKAEINAFKARDPYPVVEDIGFEPGKKFVRLNIREHIPPFWGAIVGDCVHNLRTALDHLAVILVVTNGGIPDRYTTFPISPNRQHFESSGIHRLTGASPRAIALAKRLKPYGGRNRNHPIFLLGEIDNKDKHWLLIPVGANFIGVGYSTRDRFRGAFPNFPVETIPDHTIWIEPADRQFPLKDGAILFGTDANDKTKYKFALDIAFGEGQVFDGETLVPTLQKLIDFTERTIDIFVRRILKTTW